MHSLLNARALTKDLEDSSHCLHRAPEDRPDHRQSSRRISHNLSRGSVGQPMKPSIRAFF